MDGVGDVVHVLGGQSTHVDTARLDQVDVVLLTQMVNLLYCKGKKRESLSVKSLLNYKTQLKSTVIADKKQGPKTIQSLGVGLEYTKTAVLDPATL